MDLLLIGIVTKAHGLRGEVVVEPHNSGSALWQKSGLTLFSVPRELADRAADRVEHTPERSFALVGCRKQVAGGEVRYLCTFEGVVDRGAAEALRGTHLALAMSVMPEPAADEYYHHELRGFSVIDPRGALLGTVVGVMPGPAQDLLEVRPPASPAEPKPETWFVPFVSAMVGDIDRAARTIVVDAPDGLIP